jgi:hypothetical protein
LTAQSQSPGTGLWRDVMAPALGAPQVTRRLTSSQFRTVALDRDRLATLLAGTPMESAARAPAADVRLELPWPDGGMRVFRIEESPVMEPALALQFPELKTYRGQGLDDPTASLRFDVTPFGFHAMVLSAEGTVYIDPYAPGDVVDYLSYFRRDYQRADGNSFTCGVTNAEVAQLANRTDPGVYDAPQAAHGTQLRTYRLAVAATGEYTAFYGGTVGGATAGIVTTMNRVNGLYERDLAVHMNLVATNASVIYTNATTDPYTNTDGVAMLAQNQTNLDAAIGTANYDIGHVFSTGGGGVATLGGPCNASLKARGVTGSSSPTGDAFDVDYVAHEMGHQFGATHTFNGTTSACGGGNRTSSTAYEPGSGASIMAYAGICGAENLQAHSDAEMHAASQTQIIAFITNGATGGSCPVTTATGNTPPTVNAGADFTIPIGTPFTLTASGNDADSDTLTYAWEEFDLGTAAPPNTDDGSRPIFRSFLPSSSPSRTFPKLSDILANASTFGESLPAATRAMTFRVTARDNRSGGGGTISDDMVLNVSAAAGPFLVTQPNTSVSWAGGSLQTVTWNVANTTAAPVSAANVKISLSTDGGLTFPTVISASTPNDGTESIAVPNLPTTTARIRVDAVGNVFFDLSNANFTITSGGTAGAMTTPSPGSTLTSTSVTFQWSAGSGVSDYVLSVGTTGVGSNNIANLDRGTNLSALVSGLPTNGSTVYVRLASLIGAAWQFLDYTYTASTVVGTWQALATQPGVSVNNPLLLTDGTVIVQQAFTNNWRKLTPNASGSYVNGTWSSIASMPAGYNPLYFASAVLGNGRVVVTGGEYLCTPGCSAVWTSLGATYDPATNVWTALAAPGFTLISGLGTGDAQSVVLPDGRFMIGYLMNTQMATLNPTTLAWTVFTAPGKADRHNEENWTLMPEGSVLTVDAFLAASAEKYVIASNTWVTAGSTIVDLREASSAEIGPQVLRPDGTVFVAGSTIGSAAGHTAIYTPGASASASGSWVAGPDFVTVTGTGYGAKDAPAALLPNGNVLTMVSPGFNAPSRFYEWDGTSLTQTPSTPRASGDPAFVGVMLVLPTGQILLTDQSGDVEIYTPGGSANPAWRPTITSVPPVVQPGTTYTISGTQFNGLSQGAAYGDDAQSATNYPIVRITNRATGHVFYARTHDHSTMGVATGSATVSTSFDVPAGIEVGSSDIEVVANGIASAMSPITVGSAIALTVTKAGNGSGTVTSNPAGIICGATCSASYDLDQVVVLTATPAAGSTFAGWTGDADCSDGSVTMTTAVSCTATFTLQTFALTVTKAGNGTGTVTSNPAGINCGATCGVSFNFGQVVALTATPAAGSTFAGWTGDADCSDGSVTTSAAVSCTATFTLQTFALTVTKAGNGSGTVTSNPAGINCGATCAVSFNFGQVVALTATPAAGSTFAGWTGAADCSDGSVTTSAAVMCTATFTLQTFALTVTKAGNGTGTVTSNPAGINCGATCAVSFNFGTVVALTATPAAGSTFAGWSGDADCTDGSVTMTTAVSCTATFTLQTFALTITKAGNGSGTVTSNPAGINCGVTCAVSFNFGQVVALTPTPAAGSTFAGWTGDADCSDGSVTMSAAVSCTATFTLQTFALTITKAGTGTGTVTSNPAGINCGATCGVSFNFGQVVALTPTPAAGSTFTGWTGAADCTDGSVTMSTAVSCTATFTLQTFALTITKAGNGSGTVTSNPAGINCGATCGVNFNFGQVVALTPTPSAGSTFAGWTGDADCTDGSVTMSTAVSCTATFTLQTLALTVTKAGNGSGTVTSNPAGINCGATCAVSFNFGQVVALTATPAAGSTFAGWTGAPDCSDGSVTMSAAVSCTATFNLGPLPAVTTPAPGSTLPGSSVTFQWTAGTDVTQYVMWVGTTPGGNDLVSRDCGTNLSCALTGLPTDGRPIYVRLYWLLGDWRSADYAYAAANNATAQLVTPAPASTLTASRVSFQWTGGRGVSQYYLWVGNTVGGNDLFNQDQGTNLTTTVASLPVDGRTVFVRLWSLVGGTWSSRDYTYTAVTSGAARAQLMSPAPGSTLSASTVPFQWTGGTGVSQYFLWVGSTDGSNDLVSRDAGTGLSATVTGLPADGRTLFVRLWSLVGGTWQSYSYTYAARPTSAPGLAEMTTPAPGSTLPASTVAFQWTGGTGVSQYYLWVGNTVGASDLANQDRGTNLSATVAGLPSDGRTLYVRLWSLVGPTWQSHDYIYTAMSTSPAPRAQMTTPSPGSTLPSSAMAFQWTGGTGVTQYVLWVGTTGVASNNLAVQDRGTNLSATVTGLPTNGSALFVRLWSLVGGGWQSNDYTYTAVTSSPSARAQMTSPAPGSTLTASTVGFTWTGGAGVAQYYLWVGTTGAGSNNLANQDRGTNLSAIVTGLPTNGSTLYVRLWSLTGGAWQSYDYTYTAPTGAPARAQMLTPAPGSTLAASTVMFQWTGGTGATQYVLWVGTTGVGSSNVAIQDEGTTLSGTVTSLPTGGSTIYVRLWSLVGGAWQFYDYAYMAP